MSVPASEFPIAVYRPGAPFGAFPERLVTFVPALGSVAAAIGAVVVAFFTPEALTAETLGIALGFTLFAFAVELLAFADSSKISPRLGRVNSRKDSIELTLGIAGLVGGALVLHILTWFLYGMCIDRADSFTDGCIRTLPWHIAVTVLLVVWLLASALMFYETIRVSRTVSYEEFYGRPPGPTRQASTGEEQQSFQWY